MKIRNYKQGSVAIVYDANRIQQPDQTLFDPGHWDHEIRVVGQAIGRGSTLFLETDFGPAVLRQYLRGGWPARISHDRYLFIGFERSRPMVEFNMLATLSEMDLPVPKPLAAQCRRQGFTYQGWLLMERILQVQALADLISERSQTPELWRRVGETIARFHRAGVDHADLNARNILIAENDSTYLVDFDRARFTAEDSPALRANLSRLKRSLEKLWPAVIRERLATCWDALTGGYYGMEAAA